MGDECLTYGHTASARLLSTSNLEYSSANDLSCCRWLSFNESIIFFCAAVSFSRRFCPVSKRQLNRYSAEYTCSHNLGLKTPFGVDQLFHSFPLLLQHPHEALLLNLHCFLISHGRVILVFCFGFLDIPGQELVWEILITTHIHSTLR